MNYQLLLALSSTNTDCGLTVNRWQPGVLAWVLGRSATMPELLWQQVQLWQSFWYVTDGYSVYRCLIPAQDHLVSRIYITRVEGESTRLHYLARLHPKTLCYSKSVEI